jgi:hypothetical protein
VPPVWVHVHVNGSNNSTDCFAFRHGLSCSDSTARLASNFVDEWGCAHLRDVSRICSQEFGVKLSSTAYCFSDCEGNKGSNETPASNLPAPTDNRTNVSMCDVNCTALQATDSDRTLGCGLAVVSQEMPRLQKKCPRQNGPRRHTLGTIRAKVALRYQAPIAARKLLFATKPPLLRGSCSHCVPAPTRATAPSAHRDDASCRRILSPLQSTRLPPLHAAVSAL